MDVNQFPTIATYPGKTEQGTSVPTLVPHYLGFPILIAEEGTRVR